MCDGVTCPAHGACVASTGQCRCDLGYTLNGAYCVDVNECFTGSGGCDPNAQCTNTQGGRTCACRSGFTGDGLTCVDVNECTTANGGCDVNATCTNQQGSRTCACPSGFETNQNPDAGVACTRLVWLQILPNIRPSPRNNAAIAYDSDRSMLVMFGGSGLTDTWEFDGTTWTQRLPAHTPSGVGDAAMAYDSVRRRTVLFGWNGLTSAATTWLWDGTDWTAVTPTTSPSPRSGHGMTFDTTRNRVVLFGGQSFCDVWEWNGTTWQEAWSCQSPSSGPGPGPIGFWPRVPMAFDAARGTTVIRGPSDTWSWNGTSWTRFTASGPRNCGGGLFYHSARQRIVCAVNGDAAAEWNGQGWTQIPASFANFNNGSAAYDTARAKGLILDEGNRLLQYAP